MTSHPVPAAPPDPLLLPPLSAVPDRAGPAPLPAWPGLPSLVVCVAPSGTELPDTIASLTVTFDAVVVVRDAPTARQVLARLAPDVDGPDPPAPVLVPAARGLRVDVHRQEISWNGVVVPSTPRERAVLRCLHTEPRRVWTYRQLHEAAWDGHYLGDPAAVYSTVKRLRAKLSAVGSDLRVESVRGVGLVLRT